MALLLLRSRFLAKVGQFKGSSWSKKRFIRSFPTTLVFMSDLLNVIVFDLDQFWKSLHYTFSNFTLRSVFSKWLKSKKKSYFAHNFHVFWPLETADLPIWGRIQPGIHFWYRQTSPAAAAGNNAVLSDFKNLFAFFIRKRAMELKNDHI